MIRYTLFFIFSFVLFLVLLKFLLRAAKQYKYRKASEPLFLLSSPLLASLMFLVFYFNLAVYQDLGAVLTADYRFYKGKVEQVQENLLTPEGKVLVLDFGFDQKIDFSEDVEVLYLEHTGMILELNAHSSLLFEWWNAVNPALERVSVTSTEVGTSDVGVIESAGE